MIDNPTTEVYDAESHMDSSTILDVAVSGDDLYIKFKPGIWYAYMGAGFLYSMLVNSDSVGKAFHSTVKTAYADVCYRWENEGWVKI